MKERGIFRRGKIWYIRFAGPDGRMVWESTHSTDYRKAEALRLKRKVEVQEGKFEGHTKIKCHTFAELAREYVRIYAEKQKCFRDKKYLIRQVVKKFGPIPLRNFKSMMLEKYQTEILHDGKKPATANRLMATLAHMFTKAVEWEMVEDEVLKRIRKVKALPENNRRLRFLSKEECAALIESCDVHLKPIVITALNTGMRKGEILGLKWENVALKNGIIMLGQDQTKNSERKEIPINDTLRAALSGLSRRLDVSWVFYDPKTGNRHGDIKHSFGRACRRAEIQDFRFHDLRHTFASHLVMAGVDLFTVKELLGHKTLAMTLRYAHLAPGHKANAVRALDSALSDGSTVAKTAALGGSRTKPKK